MKSFLACYLTILMLILSACKTPMQTTFVTTGVVVTTVDTALQAWGDYVRAGKATVAQSAKVEELCGHYVRAMQVAKDLMLVMAESKNKEIYKTQLDLALAAISDTSANLVAFIQPFVKKDVKHE